MRINGEKIALFRLKRGLSLREVSGISGVDTVTINRLERGRNNPRPKTVKALCDAFGASFDDLFTIEGERNEMNG